MELKKVLIIAPDSDATYSRSFPLSPAILAYLAGFFPDDVDVTLCDMANHKVDYDEDYDLICISAMTPLVLTGIEIAAKFREKGIKVIMGGHHPTFNPQFVKQYCDHVFIGEADETFPKFLNDLKTGETYDFYVTGDWNHLPDLSELNGTYFHQKTRAVLANLPKPRKDLIQTKYKYLFDTLATARGCPFGCDFCSVTHFFGNKIRNRPISDVEKEVENLGKYFILIDDNVFGMPKHNMEFFKMLTRVNKDQRKNRVYIAEGSLSVVNHPNCDQILDAAFKSGLRMVMAGIESLDAGNLEEWNIWKKIGHKKIKDQQSQGLTANTIKAIKKVQSHGIMVWGFAMFGFPKEKPDIFEKYYQFQKMTNILSGLAVICFMPETKVWHDNHQRRIPERDYKFYGGPLLTHFIDNMTPRELEDNVYLLGKKIYSWKNIFLRLIRQHPRHWILSFIIQSKMHAMNRAYLDIRKRYPLSEKYNVTYGEYLKNKEADEEKIEDKKQEEMTGSVAS